ncbi:MAG: AEC family transporter [Betaproteobacteria bacterium]|nr:AEC family transporter [Betaproteobacteria bacterium]
MSVLELLGPEFALMALGFALRRSLSWPEAGWVMLEKLNYFILFPVLLFVSIVRAPGQVQAVAPMMLAAGLSASAAFALSMMCRWIPRIQVQRFASGAQTAFRFNSYLGLALAERLGGAEGVALFSIMIAVQQTLWRELARNPLIIATLGGLLWRALDGPLPEIVQSSLSRLGQAALPLGLLCVGAALRWPRAQQGISVGDRWLALGLTSIKLIVMPAIAIVLCPLLGIHGLPGLLVVMYSALPTSPASYVLASRMGGDGLFVAQLISLSLLASAFTLPCAAQSGAAARKRPVDVLSKHGVGLKPRSSQRLAGFTPLRLERLQICSRGRFWSACVMGNPAGQKIAQGHHHIALPAPVADATDRTALGAP